MKNKPEKKYIIRSQTNFGLFEGIISTTSDIHAEMVTRRVMEESGLDWLLAHVYEIESGKELYPFRVER